MKKLIQVFTLSMMAMLCAVPALAQETAATPAAETQEDPEAKAALYKKITDNLKANQQVAYESSKEYLQKYPNDDPAIINYLKNFVTKYEKGSRRVEFDKLLVDKKWAEAFALGKQIIAEQPDDLSLNINLAWAGLKLAETGNNANNGEAMNFSMKSLQLIEAGKPLVEGKPYPDKDKQEHLGWLNYSVGLYHMKNNKVNEAATAFIKAASFDSSMKANPVTYTQLANAYETEYGRLQEAYDARFKGQPESEESKAALQQVKNFLEPMIDAYARAVAYSGDTPGLQQLKTGAKARLEELYTFAKGSPEGMDALIASVKTKPLPPQPNATIAPATAPTTTSTQPAAPATPATDEAVKTVQPGTPGTGKPANSGATGPLSPKPATPSGQNGRSPKR